MNNNNLNWLTILQLLINSPFHKNKSLMEIIFSQNEAVRILNTIKLIPPANSNSRLVDIGCYAPMLSIYNDLLGYKNIIAIGKYDFDLLPVESEKIFAQDVLDLKVLVLDVEKELLPIKSCSVDIVLLLEVLEHFSQDPMFVLSEINRILKTNGLLIISTPNPLGSSNFLNYLKGINPQNEPYNGIDANRHNRLYSISEIEKLAEDSGFTVNFISSVNYPKRKKIKIFGGVLWLIDFVVNRKSNQNRDDVILVRLQKKSGLLNRYPEWLYISRDIWKLWYDKYRLKNAGE